MAKSKKLGVRKNENVDVLCYRFAALPTNEQIIQLNKTIGCCRYLWNRMLGDHNTLYPGTSGWKEMESGFRNWES